MQLVVQKFGGTSVGTVDRIRRVAERIVASKVEGAQVVVVVSAMGQTTDELLTLAQQITPEPPGRELDMLLTAGERISMALLSMALQTHGHAAISFTGSQSGIITDNRHADARIAEIRATRIREALQLGRIVIVAGFQGVSAEREITTLGRGGSDTTAVALAAALHATRCEIYTDVPGVMTADPRVVPQARLIATLSYDEMIELAALGAAVLHPRAAEVARRFNVPLYVCSALENVKGSVIGAVEPIESPQVRGIACDERIGLVHVRAPRLRNEQAAQLAQALGAAGIWTRPVWQGGNAAAALTLVVREDHTERTRHTAHAVLGDASATEIEVQNDVAAISVVGAALQSEPALLGRVWGAFAQARIDVLCVTSSATSITCIVPRRDAAQAQRALHERLLAPP